MKYCLASVLLLLCVGCAQLGWGGRDFNAAYINEPSVYWPTVHVAGKIFDVDQDARRFDFVKNVVYDETTGEGMGRHRVHWSDQTLFVRSEPAADFSELEGPLVVRFHPANDNESAKMLAGEAFAVSAVTLFPGVEDVDAVTCEVSAGEELGFLTINGPRSGTLAVGDRQMAMSLTRRGAITVQTPFAPAQLDDGYWKGVVSGAEVGRRFVADTVTVTAVPDPTQGDDPALPRVLVIGDSISMNYNDALVAALDGEANVHRCEGNSFSSNYGMQYVDFWLGNYEQEGHQWDVIQLNHGLHDLKQTGPDAPYAVPIEDYQANLRRIITRLQASGATIIFCTTTPVPMTSTGRYGRQQGAEIPFNEAALQVVAEFPGVRVTDLCAVVNDSSVFDEGFRSNADVHYYRPEEQRVLGEAVAEGIRAALEARE